jgi:hypothetical protein
MITREELKKQCPKLDDYNFEKLFNVNNMHGFLDDDKMRKQKAYNHLIRNFYVYKDKTMTLKQLCDELVKNNEIIKIENENVIVEDGYFELSKTAIKYIKHILFEHNIEKYYKDKQKEKTETIYVDLEKLIENINK